MSLVIASVIASFACRCGGEEEDLYIGELPSKEAGLLASIPKLADLLGRCPERRCFVYGGLGRGIIREVRTGTRSSMIERTR